MDLHFQIPSSPLKSEADPIDMFRGSPQPTFINSDSITSGQILRSRKSNGSLDVTPEPPRVIKRVRANSKSKDMDNIRVVKKPKVEAKGNAILVSSKKPVVDVSQRRFLFHHRQIFEPLLPTNSKLFEKLSLETANHTKIIPRVELEDQPNLIQGGQMKDYQLLGLSFLIWMQENGMNCILGDEMGLGKTLQTLSLLAYMKQTNETVLKSHLIICPLSVLSSWIGEAARWVPSFKVLRFHGPVEERARLKEEVRSHKFDLVVTTYESYMSEVSWFKSRRWTYCVLDEGHKIKDSTSLLARKLQGLGSQHRLILTGTPVQNNLLELWSLLHWLYPTVFSVATQQAFQDAFDLTLGNYSPPFLEAVHKLLQLIMLRRTKQTVEFSVPPLDEIIVFLPLTEVQRFWYLRLLKRLDTVSLDEIFNSSIADDEGRREAQELVKIALSEKSGMTSPKYQKLVNLLLQLRRVCDHPFILKGCSPEPYEIGEHIVAASSKLQFIDKLLAELLPKGDRILIFSQWTDMLDMLEDFMALRNISYGRLDGQVPRARRALDIRLFQQEKSPYRVFLISTQAGGLGINLTRAAHVILCDSTWNPQIDRQAIARSHRIGQTKEVKVYRLICQDSVEDQMLDRLRRKLFLSIKVMSESDHDSKQKDPALKKHELLQILRGGTSALSRWDSDSADKGLGAFIASSVQEVLEKSKRTEDLREFRLKRETGQAIADHNLELDLAEEEKRLLTGISQVKTRLFEGCHHEKEFAPQWEEIKKRQRHDRSVVVNGVESIPTTVVTPKQPTVVEQTRKRSVWEHEDYCQECRDGGDLLCCNWCPRVFHPSCIGLPKNSHKLPMVQCTQHACAVCERKTAEAGGMLFRCRRCPHALCEDCLPEGELSAIGPTIPEFLILGYGEYSQVYWIYCPDCETRARVDPAWKKSWEAEENEYARQLGASNQLGRSVLSP